MNRYFYGMNYPVDPIVDANQNSYIRVLHASPGAPAVDIYVNDNPVVKDLAYKEFSEYLSLLPGKYNLKVFPAGTQANPVINANVTIPAKAAFTVAAIGTLPDISLLPIPEPYMPSFYPGVSYVKFTHLSPDAPAVDITLTDGTKLFSNVKYTEYTNYIGVRPGTYTLQVRPTGSNTAVLTIPNIEFKEGTVDTIYAVGLVEGSPPLEAITSMDRG